MSNQKRNYFMKFMVIKLSYFLNRTFIILIILVLSLVSCYRNHGRFDVLLDKEIKVIKIVKRRSASNKYVLSEKILVDPRSVNSMVEDICFNSKQERLKVACSFNIVFCDEQGDSLIVFFEPPNIVKYKGETFIVENKILRTIR